MNRREFRDRCEWLRQRWQQRGPRNQRFDPTLPGPTTGPTPSRPDLPIEQQIEISDRYWLNVPYLDELPSWTWAHSIWPWIDEPRVPMPNGRLDEEAFWLGKEQLWAMREDLA